MEHNIPVYQEFKRKIEENNKAIVITTMGTGKSYLTLEYLEENNLKALVICPRHTICNEWEKLTDKVDTITYHSFVKLKDYGDYDCYVFDEVHHSGSVTWEPVITKFMNETDKIVIGLTADPKRYSDNGKDMGEVLFDDSIVKGYTMAEAIEQKILPPITYICAMYDNGGFLSEYQRKNIDGRLLKKLEYSIENRGKIEEILKKDMPDGKRKCVVFTDSVDRITETEDVIRGVYPNATVWKIHSKLPASYNNKSIEEFRNSDEGFLITVDMLNEGLHIKGVNTVIMFRKTTSPTIYFQQIGRGMSAGKDERVTVFDFVGNNLNLKALSHRANDVRLFLTNSVSANSDQVIIKDYTRDILDVLDEIKKKLDNSWNPWEDDIIKNYYAKEGAAGCAKMLVNRTEGATRMRASMLGFTQSFWSEREDDIIRKCYKEKEIETSELRDLLPNRTLAACKSRAYALGCIEKVIREWSEEEDNILKEYYPAEGRKAFERLNNRGYHACLNRLKVLGVMSNKKKYSVWSDEEVEILKKYYPIEGMKCVKRLPDKTKNSIVSKKKELKLTYNSKVWTDKEDDILRKYYPIEGTKSYARIEGWSRSACDKRVEYLGLEKVNRASIPWNEEEDKVMMKYYPIEGAEGCAKRLNRTVASCKNRANILRVDAPIPKKLWTETEDNIIRDNIATLTYKELQKLLPDRTIKAISYRAGVLGVAKTK